MVEIVIAAVFNYLTLITIVVALLVPSVWISAAAGMSVAMIGVIWLTNGPPPSEIVASWLIGQEAVAIGAHFFGRFAR
jgi:hypothetical protein